MKAAFALILALAFPICPALSQTPAQLKQELKTKETAAKKDPDALYEVGKWAAEKGLTVEAKRIYQAVLKIKADHEGANLGVGNLKVEGKWYPAKEAQALIKKARATEYAAKGYVEVNGVWVEKEHVDDAKRGVFHHEGELVTKEEKLALLDGKVRHPDTGELIDPKYQEKAAQHYYPVGSEGRWVDEKEADTYHSDIKRPWLVRSAHCTLLSTLPLAKINEFRAQADRGYERVRPLLGTEPPTPANRPVLLIAATEDEFRQYGTELGDETSSTSAFLMREEASANVPYQGSVRVAICDGSGAFGPFSVRHAAALAYVHGKCVDAGADVPLWFLHGVGALASRLENDSDAGFYGNRLMQRGGARNLKGFFAGFAISGEMQPEEISANLYLAGLALDFAARGGDPATTDAMVAVTTALADPKKGGADKAITKLQHQLIAAEEKIGAYLQTLIAKAPR